jgi:hypothetical protein
LDCAWSNSENEKSASRLVFSDEFEARGIGGRSYPHAHWQAIGELIIDRSEGPFGRIYIEEQINRAAAR